MCSACWFCGLRRCWFNLSVEGIFIWGPNKYWFLSEKSWISHIKFSAELENLLFVLTFREHHPLLFCVVFMPWTVSEGGFIVWSYLALRSILKLPCLIKRGKALIIFSWLSRGCLVTGLKNKIQFVKVSSLWFCLSPVGQNSQLPSLTNALNYPVAVSRATPFESQFGSPTLAVVYMRGGESVVGAEK